VLGGDVQLSRHDLAVALVEALVQPLQLGVSVHHGAGIGQHHLQAQRDSGTYSGQQTSSVLTLGGGGWGRQARGGGGEGRILPYVYCCCAQPQHCSMSCHP